MRRSRKIVVLGAAAAFGLVVAAWFFGLLPRTAGFRHTVVRNRWFEGAALDDVVWWLGSGSTELTNFRWYDLGPADEPSAIGYLSYTPEGRAALLVHLSAAGVVSRVRSHRLPPTEAPRPFDRDAWSVAAPSGRGAMVRSLMGRDTLIGLSEQELVVLLGEPTGMRRHYYCTGLHDGIAPESLTIPVDEDLRIAYADRDRRRR